MRLVSEHERGTCPQAPSIYLLSIDGALFVYFDFAINLDMLLTIENCC